MNPYGVDHDENEQAALVINNGTFKWDDHGPVLKNVNMRVEHHQLVAVVGPVGCGKSSLISAFLGEMEKETGRINQVGKIAFVAQQAWIQNATLKANVLFGQPLDQKKYERVLEACALLPDLETLPAGDLTEIGEKGINLSGGQKQRVALARAVYQDADVYLLDDPLSAVDVHVGKHIFESVIGPNGILKNKTRVLVTHSIIFLPVVDQIFVMLNGEVSESGTYNQLLDKKGAFSEFLNEYQKNPKEEEVDGSQQDLSLEGFRKRKYSRETSCSSKNSDTNKVAVQEVQEANSTEDLAKGKTLIKKERAEVGKVDWNVYLYYFKWVGNHMAVAAITLIILSQASNLLSNIWLSRWSTDPKAEEDKWRNIYLIGYGVFGFGQGKSFDFTS